MPQIRRRSPLPCPQSPRPFLPPSHYAAAAGMPYSSSLKVPRGSDHESSVYPLATTSPRDIGSASLRRNSLVPISYPAEPVSSESFESDGPVDMGANNTSTKTKRVSTPSPRLRHRSNLGDLPLLETQLLPSLRDTIDRMTRSPASPASSFFESSAYGRRSRSASISTAESGPLTIPSVRSPSTPQANTTRGPLSPSKPARDPFSVKSAPIETSTPRQKPRIVLKSALKSSTPQMQAQRMDVLSTPQPTSPAMSLRSVKSIIGNSRKTPSLAQSSTTSRPLPVEPVSRNSLAKLHAKISRSNEGVHGTRSGRTRSRTDPGTSLNQLAQVQLPATPQPYYAASDLARAERLPQKDDPAAESELEFRFEMEARERRRLVVTNANVVPSSSESDGENTAMARNFRTRLPVFTGKWELADHEKNNKDKSTVGLGFNFDKKANHDGVRSGDIDDGDDDLSVYDDQEPEPDKTMDSTGYSADHSSFSSQSRSSMDKLDEEHRRRREALMGIVSGLEAGLGTTFADVSKTEDSDYCGQEGLAISGSCDIGVDEKKRYTAKQQISVFSAKSFASDRDDKQDSYDRTTIAPLEITTEGRLARPRLPSGDAMASVLRTPVQTSACRSRTETDYENATNLPSNNRRSSRSPIVRTNTDIALPPALRRYSVYDACGSTATARYHCREEPTGVGIGRTYGKDAMGLAESSQVEAACQRKALGIPPSESDNIFQRYVGSETGVMTHADSVLSSVDSALSVQDCDELSVGAEELFRKLSGENDVASSEKTKIDTGAVESSEDNALSTGSFSPPNSAWRNSSSRQSKPSTLDFDPLQENLEEATAADLPPKCDKWGSTLPKVTYDSLLRQYGELEMQRQEVIRELWETEKAFVESMRTMVSLFVRPLRVKNTRIWISGIPSDVARLFDWLEDILNLHKQILSALQTSLVEQSPMVERVAAPLRNFVARFEVYQPYMVRLEGVTETIKTLRREPSSDFGEFVRIQEVDCRDWNLENFLAEPLSRLKSYPVLFEKMKDLTPKDHPDFLPTLSLLHSTKLVMGVMNEVKAREDHYGLVKDILARVEGLPPSVQLAKRERRLLAHGLLECIENPTSQNHSVLPDLIGDHVRYKSGQLVEAIKDWNVRRARAGSVRSTSSSFESNDSRSSTSSGFPPTPSSECYSSRYNIASPSPKSKEDSGFTCLMTSDGYVSSRGGHGSMAKTRAAHAFVFSDVVLFTSPKDSKAEDKKWSLMKGIGLARVLDVTEVSVPSNSVIVLDLIPVDAEGLDTGIIPDRLSVKTIHVCIPGDAPNASTITQSFMKNGSKGENSGDDEIRQKWMSALERCSQSTLQLLSYPPLLPSGEMKGYGLGPSGGGDLEMDTLHPLRSILASGLPLPKSPSIQRREEEEDEAQMEREERGWWTLRFQQVLLETQRRGG